MTEHPTDIELADLYVRDKLSGDEEADFEVRMLESPQLQQHVETALAIQESLKLDQAHGKASPMALGSDQRKAGNPWGNMALAASVLLAVVSTVMLARTSIESDRLKQQVAELSQPQSSVLTVPISIMRSLGSGSPDVIVQKPPDGSVIQLDIELSRQSLAQPLLQFALESETESPILAWQTPPSANGRTTVLLQSRQIPTGLAQLSISDIDGNTLQSFLLEFR
jgi:hypothetical protein